MNANAGSQLHLQKLIEQRPNILTAEIQKHFGIQTSIDWVSPIGPGYKEYQDGAALQKLGIELKMPLKAFWPKGGPVWDALGVGTQGQAFLVEAKANVEEMISPPTGATGESLDLIKSSLLRVKTELKIKNELPWDRQFYQYFNRLAWLYFLREDNGYPTYLVFLYFTESNVSGKYCPTTAKEWEAVIHLMESLYKVGHHRLSNYVTHVILSADRKRPK